MPRTLSRLWPHDGIWNAPTVRMARTKTLGSLFSIAAVGILALAPVASSTAAAEEDNGCRVSDAEYLVDTSVLLKGTPMGAADGVHPLGRGRMRLRFQPNVRGESVKLMSYVIDNRMTVETNVAFIKTTVVAESRTKTLEDACHGSALGSLSGSKLTWQGAVRGYGSEGVLRCDGVMCGKFGAPPKGASPLRDHPSELHFGQFVFSPDGSTFTMPYTEVQTTTPGNQHTFLALSGRRLTHACVAEPAACGSTASAQ